MEGNVYIQDLLVKFTNGELSDPEKATLLNWTEASAENKELMESLSNFEAVAREIAEMEDDKELAWTNLVQQIPDWKVKRIPLLGRLAVAASIIVTVITGILLLYNSSKFSQSSTSIAVQQSAAPSKNQAILTKSDGSKINIDSLPVGTTMLDGGAKIIKSQNGQITYLSGSSSKEAAYNTISVPAGSTQVVHLSDKSVVYLNALSSLYFPTSFEGQTSRTVRLTGEAYFEVAHNTAQKFNVQIDSMTLTVLGTEFNVNGYKEENIVKSTLFTDSIRVTQKEFSVVLVPGQQLQFDRNNRDVKIVADADLEAVAAWKDGVFALEGIDIGVLMRQIGRWHNLQVVFPYGEPQGKMSGEIAKKTELGDLLKILQANKINVRLEGNKLVVLK
jgi:transmembrane sensor